MKAKRSNMHCEVHLGFKNPSILCSVAGYRNCGAFAPILDGRIIDFLGITKMVCRLVEVRLYVFIDI